MNIAKIKEYLDQFAALRNWNKFRTPKNLSMALSVETAELMEKFQWMDGDESRLIGDNEQLMQEVSEEIADVFSYLVQISSILNVDLEEAFWRKSKKNEAKYPLKLCETS